VHRTGRISALAPSNWLADLAVSSGKLSAKPIVVSNGVDLGLFRPAYDRKKLRAELGIPIPHDRPVILLSASSLRDERKGILQSLALLHAIKDLKPFALVVGMADGLSEALGQIDHRTTGYIGNKRELARWYAAADIHLFCSLAESFSLVVLETMACGTPTVGFATGAVPELVEQDRSGLLVSARDLSSLEDAVRFAVKSGFAAAWGRAARIRAEENYSMETFCKRHIELYSRSLAKPATSEPL
jgi:glycosyltransferase involved in cell wall biosynthesis